MSCSFPLNAAVTFSRSQTRGWHVPNLCLSSKLGRVPALLKMGQICLSLIQVGIVRAALPPSELVSLDKRDAPRCTQTHARTLTHQHDNIPKGMDALSLCKSDSNTFHR